MTRLELTQQVAGRRRNDIRDAATASRLRQHLQLQTPLTSRDVEIGFQAFRSLLDPREVEYLGESRRTALVYVLGVKGYVRDLYGFVSGVTRPLIQEQRWTRGATGEAQDNKEATSREESDVAS